MQDRPEGCLSVSPITPTVAKVCKLQMGGKVVPVSSPLFRSWSCPKDIHKIDENSNSSHETFKRPSYYLSRRLSDPGLYSPGGSSSTRYSDIHLGTFRLHNKLKKSLLPTQLIEFLGVEVDSINMKLSLPQEKVEGIISQCQMMLSAEKVSIRDLMKLSGRLSSSAIAVLPAPLQYRAIQRQQIQELASSQNYDSLVTLTEEVKEELDWWCQNLLLSNGRSLVQASPQLVIAADASLQGWGATNGQWSPREQDLHINILELKAAKLAIISFHRIFPNSVSIHIQMDNITALCYLKKMGGTRCQILTEISKEIWKYLLDHQITITVEYLPGVLNIIADKMSRSVKDLSEWMLNPKVFQILCKARGIPCTDLFASRLTHQVPVYYAWKIDPYSRGQDAFQACWTHLRGYAFPPFCLIGKVLWKVKTDYATIVIVTPAWQTQSWYPQLLHMSIKNPLLLPQRLDLLSNIQGEYHPLLLNHSLQLVAWTVSGIEFKQQAFQRRLSDLSPQQGEMAQSPITSRPGISRVADVVEACSSDNGSTKPGKFPLSGSKASAK